MKNDELDRMYRLQKELEGIQPLETEFLVAVEDQDTILTALSIAIGELDPNN